MGKINVDQNTMKCFYCGRMADSQNEGHFHIGEGCAEHTGCRLCVNVRNEKAFKNKYFCDESCEVKFFQEKELSDNTGRLERFSFLKGR